MNFLFVFLAFFLPFKKDPPRTFQVVVASENAVYKNKRGEHPLKKQDKLNPKDLIVIPAGGFCVLFDNRGNVFELSPGTTLPDTLAGRADGRSEVAVSRLYSQTSIVPVGIMDRNVCSPLVAFPAPFSSRMRYNAGELVPIHSSTAGHQKFEIRDVFDEYVADIDITAPGFIDLANYSGDLSDKDQYIITAKDVVCNSPTYQFFAITKTKTKFHDLNLTDTSPALLQKALYFEFYNYLDKAGELYQQAIAQAPASQVAVYENFFELFKRRNNL